MYKELIKRLRDAATMSEALAVLLPHSEGNATAKLYNEAADAIEEAGMNISHLERDYKELCSYLPKWIPVTERLPEEKTYVLILADTIAGKLAKVSLIYKDSAGRNCWTALDEYGKNPFDWQPTHWMPLPEPPKEET